LGAYSIHIVGLDYKAYDYEYEIGAKFFEEFGKYLLSEGSFHVSVVLHKHETFIETTFHIKGSATLVCDRSLDTFEYPIDNRFFLVFKFGDADEEMSDEIVMIHRDTVTLDLGHYIYEFIGLSIPLKKLHPRYSDEEVDDESEGSIVYTSTNESDAKDDDGDDDIDPRWNILKNLK
jgi:uncharacterized protein